MLILAEKSAGDRINLFLKWFTIFDYFKLPLKQEYLNSPRKYSLNCKKQKSCSG